MTSNDKDLTQDKSQTDHIRNDLQATAEKLHGIRRDMDYVRRFIDAWHAHGGVNNNTFNALTALRLAKANLGNALGELGIPNPYYEAKTVEDIPVETDLSEPGTFDFRDRLYAINTLKREMKGIKGKLRKEMEPVKYVPIWALDHMRQSYMSLCTSSHFLGFELGDMRTWNDYTSKEKPDIGGEPNPN